MKCSKIMLLCLVFAVTPYTCVGCHASGDRAAIRMGDLGLLAGWIADSADNLCGLDDPGMLSHPARVNYMLLYRATPEVREMEEKHIDPASAQGAVLRHAAENRIHRACEAVRVAKGYCSIWKNIRHVDGRAIDDVTQDVRPQL